MTVVPAVADAGAMIDSFVLWHRAGVALVRGALTPANSIAAPARATAASVEMVIVFFILPLREIGRGGACRHASHALRGRPSWFGESSTLNT